jgi:hypothetical protein
MKYRETKFREIIPFVLREILCLFRELFATKFRFLHDKVKKQCCGDGAGNCSIIYVTLFYIMKWWRHKFP